VQVTVVIPTLNARGLLADALASLERQTLRAQVVVVDNASTDGTAELLQERFPQVRVLRNETNLGFGRAINRVGLELAGDVLVLVNNDVVCEPRFLELLCEPFADPAVGAVAGVLLQSSGRIDSAGVELDTTLQSYDYLWNRPPEALAGGRNPVGPCGGAAAYRLSAYRALGGFDERLFAYWEDVDLALRLHRAGWRCVLAPGARAEHRHGATLGAASPAQRRLEAFGRGYVLGKFGVTRGRPLAALAVAVLDWPALAVHLLVRRELGPLRAHHHGRRLGAAAEREDSPPLELATVGFREALARQAGFLRLRLTGTLPPHFHEHAPTHSTAPPRTPSTGRG